MNKELKEKIEKIREPIITILLVIWFFIPILKNLKATASICILYEHIFVIFFGIIGLFFLFLELYINFVIKENKKEYIKEILPICVFGIFMIWTFISAVFSTDIENAFFGSSYRKEGYLTYLGYAGFFSCAYLMKVKHSKEVLAKLFVVLAVINIIIVELYNKGIFTNIFIKRDITTNCFYQFNHYGYYLLMATVSSIFLSITQKNKFRKVISMLCAVVLLYYLIVNDTFGCFVALAITMLFFVIYCIYNKKIKIRTIILIIMVLSLAFISKDVRDITQKNMTTLIEDLKNINIGLHEENNKEAEMLLENAGTYRIKLWKNGIKFFLERPILGYGPDNLGEKYKEVGIYINDRPHNLLIQLATTSGVIGLITYVTAVGIIWIRGLKNLRFENHIHIISFFIVTAYLISAMFGNSMYYTSPYFFIFLGFLMGENASSVRKEEKQNKNEVIKNSKV